MCIGFMTGSPDAFARIESPQDTLARRFLEKKLDQSEGADSDQERDSLLVQLVEMKRRLMEEDEYIGREERITAAPPNSPNSPVDTPAFDLSDDLNTRMNASS